LRFHHRFATPILIPLPYLLERPLGLINMPVSPPCDILPPPSTHDSHTYMDIWCIFSIEFHSPLPVEPSTPMEGDFHSSPYSTPSIDAKTITNLDKTFGPIMPHLPINNFDDAIFSYIFQSDEDTLETMTTFNCPWYAIHHRSLFLAHKSFQPNIETHIYVIETKEFIPPRHVDWFKK
jgi:hypothetical protein